MSNTIEVNKDPIPVESEKPLSEAEELKKWFQDILDTETFEIDYYGKKFVFNKYFPISIASKIKSLPKEQKSVYLISYLSVKPKLPMSLIMNDQDSNFAKMVSHKITEFNPVEPVGESNPNLSKEKTSYS